MTLNIYKKLDSFDYHFKGSFKWKTISDFIGGINIDMKGRISGLMIIPKYGLMEYVSPKIKGSVITIDDQVNLLLKMWMIFGLGEYSSSNGVVSSKDLSGEYIGNWAFLSGHSFENHQFGSLDEQNFGNTSLVIYKK